MGPGRRYARKSKDSVIADLIGITETQFDKWTAELNKASNQEISASLSINYWYILSGIFKREVQYGEKIIKEETFKFIPAAKENTGRKYVSLCGAMGLISTEISQDKRWVKLNESARKAVRNTAIQWIRDFGQFYEEMKTLEDGQ